MSRYSATKRIPAPPNTTASGATTTLGFWMCHLVDPPDNGKSSGVQHFTSSLHNGTYKCFITSKYLTSNSVGPTLCVLLCTFIVIVGILGIVGNLTVMHVLKHSTAGSFLKRLLIILAGFDLLASCFGVCSAVIIQVITNNHNRSKGLLVVFRICFLLYSLGRTGSVFLTILVAIERYLVVVYPFKARSWLTPRRATGITIAWLVGILFINLPWWFTTTVEKNHAWEPKSKLSKYPYIFAATGFANKVYFGSLQRFHRFIDFALPLPLLLLFNGLLYRFIYKWNKRRSMTGNHHLELHAAKMFSVVVSTLLLCHSCAFINFLVQEITQIDYREFVLATVLAVTLNAMINFFIYYAFNHEFRQHFWTSVGSKVLCCKRTTYNVDASEQVQKKREVPSGDILIHEVVQLTNTTTQPVSAGDT